MIHNEIAGVIKEMMRIEPFYGFFSLTLNKVIRNDIDTACVGRQGINTYMAVNENFWNSLSPEHKYGLIKHELLHIVFLHLTFRDSFNDKLLFNIAADTELHCYVAPEHIIDGAMTIDKFPELNLQPREGTASYYTKMQKALDEGSCEFLTNTYNYHKEQGRYHTLWSEFDNLPEAEKDLIRKQIEHQLKETAQKSRGFIPGELTDMINELFKVTPPVFDWKSYLRRFIGTSYKVYTRKSRRKLNRRYAGNPAIKVKHKHEILVAVDTSGSVSNEELIEFFNEIHHIYKTGVAVTVAQCDADIHDIREYTGTFDGRIAGRGGTNFQPVIDYYDQNVKRYSTLIFLTDGECSAPTTPRGSMLWVMSSRAKNLDAFEKWPGYKIKIPNESNK